MNIFDILTAEKIPKEDVTLSAESVTKAIAKKYHVNRRSLITISVYILLTCIIEIVLFVLRPAFALTWGIPIALMVPMYPAHILQQHVRARRQWQVEQELSDALQKTLVYKTQLTKVVHKRFFGRHTYKVVFHPHQNTRTTVHVSKPVYLWLKEHKDVYIAETPLKNGAVIHMVFPVPHFINEMQAPEKEI